MPVKQIRTRGLRDLIAQTVSLMLVSTPAFRSRVPLAFAAGCLLMMASASHAQGSAQALLPVCGACHGADGNSVIAGTPSLAGQPKLFIENQLVLIREGLREVPVMKGVLAKLSDEDLVGLAKLYSEMPAKPPATDIDAARIKRGAEISQAARCASCHSPDYSGREQMPRLAMQREDFLIASLKEFRNGPAAGRDTVMASTLRGMTDSQLEDLAHYFATAGRHPK